MFKRTTASPAKSVKTILSGGAPPSESLGKQDAVHGGSATPETMRKVKQEYGPKKAGTPGKPPKNTGNRVSPALQRYAMQYARSGQPQSGL